MFMRSAVFFILSALVVAACGTTRSDERRYTLQGQIVAIDPSHKSVIVKHEEIKGFMPGMTMPYDVENAKALDGMRAGDLINATLVVFSNGAHLTAIKKVGEAPL